MNKDRSARLTALVALVAGVVGVSVGFASFTNSIVIKTNGHVSTNPNEFKVELSTKNTEVLTTSQSGTVDPVTQTFGGATTDSATVVLDNSVGSNPRIANLNAYFNAPGQSVTYTFYAVNTGMYDAFLKSLSASAVANPTVVEGTDLTQTVGTGSYVVCTAAPDDAGDTSITNPNTSVADKDLLKSACDQISLEVTAKSSGNKTAGPLKLTTTGVSGAQDSLTEHVLQKDTTDNVGDYDTLTVTISYGEEAQRVDGNFQVQFGDVTLVYNSVD